MRAARLRVLARSKSLANLVAGKIYQAIYVEG